jgi:site-specific DNA recombinase
MTTEPTIPQGNMGELVRYFLRLGFLGFGGPVALVGQMERELVTERKWLTIEQMREAIAICQSLPGPLAIQVGIYVAYLRCGFWGAWAGGWSFILQAVHDGTADAILIGIRGLVGQMQREDGAKKVRRGMAGVVRDGRHAGGRAYGYRAVLGHPGQLEIVEEEASIVRRIFAAYAAGRPPRDIAHDLNREGVRPPRGKHWNASTINGNAQRGSGLIFNDLYVGRIVWNKVRMVKNPDTGKRISRPNDRDQWQAIEAPHLRIVDDETWETARRLKAGRADLKPHLKRRPPHVLSGLHRCGFCGSGMSVHDRDKTDKTRLRCSAVRESGSCSNRRIIYLRDVERAVLRGMREELKDPRLIEAYARNCNEKRQRLAANSTSTRARLEAKRTRIESERQRNIDLVVKQVIGDDDARDRIAELKAQRLQIEAELAALEEAPSIVTLHPATLDQYIETVDALAVSLADHSAAEDDRGALVASFRALMHSVTIHPNGPREGFQIEVKGKLSALIGGNAFPQANYSGVSVVAGERYRFSPHEPNLRYFLRSFA